MLFKEFEWVSPRKLAMKKKLFSEHELSLAACLNLEVDIDTMTVYADLHTTAKQALFEFIKECFRAFSHNLDAADRRDEFYSELNQKYDEIYAEVYSLLEEKIPYYGKLLFHQNHGIATMAYKKFNFLYWDMRVGKSITAATISKIFNIKRTLIISPQVVKYSWFRQLTEDWGYNPLYFSIIDANKRRSLKAFQERWVIINYDILGKEMETLLNEDFGHIILDEAHYLKGIQTHRFRAVKKIIEHNPSARISFLSGSGVSNRINDVFAYLKLIGSPLGSNYSMFLRNYTNSTSGRYGQLKIGKGRNLTDLFRKMSNFIIRRKVEECLQLPERTTTRYIFELDDYREEYNKVIAELIKQKSIHNLDSCIHSLNIVMAKSKIKGVIETAEMIISSGKKVVVFSGYTEPLNILQEKFKESCVRIDGSVPADKRDSIIQQFWKDENIMVFLGNRKAAGVGIDLSIASDVINIDFPMVPSELLQAEARVLKHEKKNNIGIHYMVCKDSIDESLYNLISEKQADINSLIDRGKETINLDSIPEKLFKKLLEEYEQTNGKEKGEEVSEHNQEIGPGGEISEDKLGEQEVLCNPGEDNICHP